MVLNRTGKYVYSTGSSAGNYYKDSVTNRGLDPLMLDFVGASEVAQENIARPVSTGDNVNCGIWGVDQRSASQDQSCTALELPHVLTWTLDINLRSHTPLTEMAGTMYLGGVGPKSQYNCVFACVPALPADGSKRVRPPPGINTANAPLPNEIITNAIWWQVEVDSYAVVGSMRKYTAVGAQALFDSGAPTLPHQARSGIITAYLNMLPDFTPQFGDAVDFGRIHFAALPTVEIRMSGLTLLFTPEMCID